ncbi:MAG: hypothetical protein FWD25_03560 [Clostridia bacterium]|nr:hypothetical protein [Clostridia bacterium]
MSKTVFDVEDIHALRAEREAEYASMSKEDAQKLRTERANDEWNEIAKMRGMINAYYKCPNILSVQPDKLPAMQFAGETS